MSGLQEPWMHCTHQETGACSECFRVVIGAVERLTRERDEARTIASANGHADLVAQRDRANAKAARLTKALVSITQLSEPHATAHGIAIKALNGGDE